MLHTYTQFNNILGSRYLLLFLIKILMSIVKCIITYILFTDNNQSNITNDNCYIVNRNINI